MTEWRRRYEYHTRMIRIAQQGQVSALKLRCEFYVDTFTRCTADAGVPHEHRHEAADLPGALSDEERWKA